MRVRLGAIRPLALFLKSTGAATLNFALAVSSYLAAGYAADFTSPSSPYGPQSLTPDFGASLQNIVGSSS